MFEQSMQPKAEIHEKIKIIIADDHTAFRERFSRLLMDAEDMEVIGQAADGAEAFTLAWERSRKDLVIALWHP